IGASLALTPLVWAESAPGAGGAPPAPQTMTSPVALTQQQSFAPLVKKVLPAVVNISVTQKSDAVQKSEEPAVAPFKGLTTSPFEELMRRFFEQQVPNGEPHLFPQIPGNERVALGSGFVVDPRGYVVTNNHVIGNSGKIEVILQDKTKYRATVI